MVLENQKQILTAVLISCCAITHTIMCRKLRTLSWHAEHPAPHETPADSKRVEKKAQTGKSVTNIPWKTELTQTFFGVTTKISPHIIFSGFSQLKSDIYRTIKTGLT